MPNNENKDSNTTPVKKQNTKFLKIIMILSFLVIVVGVTVGFISYNQIKKLEEEKIVEMEKTILTKGIYENVFINNIDVGGLTKEEAISKLKSEIQNITDTKPIALINNNNNEVFDFKFKDFDFKYDINTAVKTALDYAKDGELEKKYNAVMNLKEEPLEIEMTYTYNDYLADKNLLAVSKNVYLPPVEASMKRENGSFVITEGSSGVEMNMEDTLLNVKSLLENNESGEISVTTKLIEPKYNYSDLQKAQSILGSFSSRYTGIGSPRVHNMEVASKSANNILIYPGEVFSTEEVFGPSTEANGYSNAPVIEKGKLVDGIGGGICQISSTLYVALLKSELEIVERRNHSLKVGYMDWGFDATLAEGYIDLKFKNNTELPVLVESYMTNDQVVINVYGEEERSSARTLEFSNELVKTTPAPPAKTVNNPNLASGQRIVSERALDGRTYNVYKSIYENGIFVDKVLVNTSVYKPRAEEVEVGTGVAVVAETPVEEVPVETPNDILIPVDQAPVEELPVEDAVG